MSKEFFIGKKDELKNGEMKEVEAGDHKLLLSRIDDKYYIVDAHCNHYGAPLKDGVLSGERVVCPWHHAVFNAKTGKALDGPAIDDIPALEVQIKEKDLIVELPEEYEGFKIPDMVAPDKPKSDHVFVIIGGGAAGNMAAQTLREDGFEGRLIMISEDERLPYDRPNVSKEYLSGEAPKEWMTLRSEDFYDKYKIELMMNNRVSNINTENYQITYEQGTLAYHRALIATGGSPVKLDLPGADLENIMYLRSYTDADRLIDAQEGKKNIKIIGASFIAMETADSLTKRGHKVTVIAPELVPFEKVFGTDIGALFKEAHKQQGVDFKLGRKPKEFKGEGKVEKIVLDNGETYDADLVIIGVGIEPNADISGNVRPNDEGSLDVDKYLRISNDVYAAGDVARYVDRRTGEKQRIEHWRTAHQQGQVAALNMNGRTIEYKAIPFFWTRQAGLSIKYLGHAKKWDEIIFAGNVEDKKFLAYYVKDKKVHAVAGMNMHKAMAAIEELMRMEKMPLVSKLDEIDILEYFESVK